MKVLQYSLVLLLLFSCNTNSNKKPEQEKEAYDMYDPSEMAILMNQMYDHNMQIKKDILDGHIPNEFPLDFLKIHTAELSDFKSRNANFESFSKLFIDAEREVFNTTSETPIKERFNYAVGLCISCHKTECTGPIPRIKKLLIK